MSEELFLTKQDGTRVYYRVHPFDGRYFAELAVAVGEDVPYFNWRKVGSRTFVDRENAARMAYAGAWGCGGRPEGFNHQT